MTDPNFGAPENSHLNAPQATPGGGQEQPPKTDPVIAELRSTITPSGLVTAALMLAIPFVVSFVISLGIFIFGLLQPGLPSVDVGLGTGIFFLIAAAVLSGGLGVDLDTDVPAFSQALASSGSGEITIVFLSALVATAVGVVLVVRQRTAREARSAARPWWAMVVRSLVEALVVALVVTIFVAVTRVSLSNMAGFPGSGGVGVYAQANAGTAFLTTFLVIGAAATWARLASTETSLRSGLARSAREVGWYLAIPLTVLTFVALIASFFIGDSATAAPLLWYPLGMNAAALAFGMAQFGGLTSTVGPLGSTSGHLWDIIGGWSALVIALTLLTLVFLTVFLGVRRGRIGRFDLRRVWQLPAAVLVIWFLVSGVLLPISVGFGLGSVRLAPSLETPLLVALFAAAVSVAAEVMPGIVYSLSPQILAFLAGKQATNAWVQGSPVSAPASVAPAPYPPVVPAPDAPAPVDPSGVTEEGPTTGAAVNENAAAMDAPPPLAGPAPMSRKAKRVLFAVLGAVAGIIVLGGAGLVTVGILNAQRDPGEPVREYLETIADGRLDDATEMVDPGLRTAERVLLTNGAVTGDASASFVVGDVTVDSRSDSGATVTAKYSVDGESFSQTFTVTPGPKEFLVLDTWTLSDAEALVLPVQIDLPDGVPSVTVGDVTVPAPEISEDEYSSQATLYAYPGVYNVAFDGKTTFVDVEGDSTVRIVADGTASITASVTETDALRDAVMAEVTALAKACATVPTNMEDYCPYGLQQSDLASMSIVSMPEEFESFGDGRFSTEDIEYSTTDVPRTWNPTPSARESTFTFSGSYEIDGDEVEVEIGYGW